MKQHRLALPVAAVSAFVLLGAVSARADLIYDNGPATDLYGVVRIDSGYSVSDSFDVTSATNLTSVQIGLVDFPGTHETNVDWSIGTTPFGSDIGSGVAPNMTSVFQFHSASGYNIDTSSFAVNGTVGPGTYYLTLQNAVNPGITISFWDMSTGPSTAVAAFLGTVYTTVPADSDSFQIYGTPVTTSATPEPGAYALLGSLGLTGIGFLRRRKAARTA